MESGLIQKDPDLIKQAIRSLDSLWERDLIAEGYTALARGIEKDTRLRREAAEKLYALNKGALRQKGIRLPIRLKVELTGTNPNQKALKKIKRSVSRVLDRSGFHILKGDSSRFILDIELRADAAVCILRDEGRGLIVQKKAIPLPSLRRSDLCTFALGLADTLFQEK
ncbi:hypothetical protein MASR2M78_11270 [Treponema sp.]